MKWKSGRSKSFNFDKDITENTLISLKNTQTNSESNMLFFFNSPSIFVMHGVLMMSSHLLAHTHSSNK